MSGNVRFSEENLRASLNRKDLAGSGLRRGLAWFDAARNKQIAIQPLGGRVLWLGFLLVPSYSNPNRRSRLHQSPIETARISKEYLQKLGYAFRS